ncbi:HD-GYP domain-containing protein [Vibrio rotiferianus]|uniref:HD-GYP domain-containing protein n=1 Tax=Vibrio rotiferianus TaxID=190895 RepID=UPI00390A707E
MLDYPLLSKTATKEKKTTAILDELFKLAQTSYPEFSRFSVVLIKGNKASNYYVNDTIAQPFGLDFEDQELRINSSLTEVAYNCQVRIVDDLENFDNTERIKKLIKLGHKSSYASPIYNRGSIIGFLFCNATKIKFFSDEHTQRDFAYLSQIISGMFIQLDEKQKHFQSALAIALKMGHERDPETAEHLIRMGKYSERLARLLADKNRSITPEFIHRIRLYAPFHDIGKYKIPDDVLFSDKRFTAAEREVMNQHTIFGERIIEDVVALSDTSMIAPDEVQFIKNIIRHHHEYYNGTGLPDALCGDDIPLEARIVTLADVFDALLSKRAYKAAWSLSDTANFIKEHRLLMFDPDCVDMLIEHLDEFLAIRAHHRDHEGTQNAVAC